MCCRPAIPQQGTSGIKGPRPRQAKKLKLETATIPQVGEHSTPYFIAGNIANHLQKWQTLTSDQYILQTVSGLEIEFHDIPRQSFPRQEYKLKPDIKNKLAIEIRTMLRKGIIEVAEDNNCGYVSAVFARPKRDGSTRCILDLKHLNHSVTYRHFKMDTLTTALSLVTPGCYFASLDLSDAYYSVNVHPSHRNYLKFYFQGQMYRFTCLPNGLSSGPRQFTKLLKVPISHLRCQYQHTIIAYLDDTLFIENTSNRVSKSLTRASSLLQDLGFLINYKKSVFIPNQEIEFLGFTINSVTMQVCLTGIKVSEIGQKIKYFKALKTVKIREAAILLGKMSASLPGNRYAALYSKKLEMAKIQALAMNRGNYDAYMAITPQITADLLWWESNLSSITRPIYQPDPCQTFNTDASGDGWGYFCSQTQKSTQGRWTLYEQKLHINIKELLAVYHTLEAVYTDYKNCHLRVNTDNTTTMLCINNQGSTKSIQCNNIARKIWEWAITRNIWISSAFCPGKKNVMADQASRKFNDRTEWALDKRTFRTICNTFGWPDIDLFASRTNKQVDKFCSWFPEPGAFACDAFTISWRDFYIYAFPPFSLIPRVMQKILADRPKGGIMVVPDWPTQPWYTIFLNRMKDTTRIKVKADTLRLRHNPQQTHPLAGKLFLLVGQL